MPEVGRLATSSSERMLMRVSHSFTHWSLLLEMKCLYEEGGPNYLNALWHVTELCATFQLMRVSHSFTHWSLRLEMKCLYEEGEPNELNACEK